MARNPELKKDATAFLKRLEGAEESTETENETDKDDDLWLYCN